MDRSTNDPVERRGDEVTKFACAICESETHKPVAGTPYHECAACLVWEQHPLPPKVFQTPDEYDIDEMPPGDVEVNKALARSLFYGPMRKRAGRTLDVGAKHPVLAGALFQLGCEPTAIDGVLPRPHPGVVCKQQDFESMRISPTRDKYRLITFVHVWEHVYRPLEALRKVRLLCDDDGRVFMRMPDHYVSGFEQHLSEHHYKIHPWFYCLTGMLELLAQSQNLFMLESTYAMEGAGQRDYVLRPL